MASEAQFGHMSLEDMRVMLSDVVRSGPNPEDREFVKGLTNEIAAREKQANKEVDAAFVKDYHTGERHGRD